MGLLGTNGGISGDWVGQISMAMYGDAPYLAYSDDTNDEKATVKKYNGTSWETVGDTGFSAGPAIGVNLAFNQTVPYVVYTDFANEGKATVQKFNGTTWETVGNAGFSAGNANGTAIAFNGTTPYVVYSDNAQDGKVTVQKFDGTDWQIVGSAGFSVGATFFTALAIDEGTPYVVYSDDAQAGKITVQKFNGTTWETVGNAGFSVDFVHDTKIVFYNHVPYVVYSDDGLEGKAIVKKFNGTTWEQVGNGDISVGGANTPSLIFNGATPYIAYGDGVNDGKVTVKKFDGTNWEIVGSAGFTTPEAYYPQLGFSGNTLYVGYTSDDAYMKKIEMGTLPVTLVNFTAKADGNYAKLQWQTANEVNHKGFEIYRGAERLEGGRIEDFVKIGEVSALVTHNTQPVTYNFTDKNPLNGTNYYKLVQIDNDGKAIELGVRTVAFYLHPSTLNLYPNPTTNEVTVNWGNALVSSIKLVDVSGKILQVIQPQPSATLITISLANYPAGTYVLRIEGNMGVEIRKIVKL